MAGTVSFKSFYILTTLEANEDKILCYVTDYVPELEKYHFWRQDDLGFINSLTKCIYAKAFLT